VSQARKFRQSEKYDLKNSPFSQCPTQREVAKLLGETRDDLRRIINYKEQFVVRRTEQIGGKIRSLIYPVSRYRALHERLKFHLNKIRQPSYLFSPRKGGSQRNNAALHLDQDQYLRLDLKQFYPSTTESMVRAWFRDELGMYEDVAGLLTELCTIDGKVSFGSPLTPVLCTLVHRTMFDRISDVCQSRWLRHSVWVDDVTISGRFVPGQVVNEVRQVIMSAGLRSHEIKYRSGNRPVFITGIGVVGQDLVAPNSLHLRIRDLWKDLKVAKTVEEKDFCTQRLLSQLGTLRHIVGRQTSLGQRTSNQMNMLRQRRAKFWNVHLEHRKQQTSWAQSDFQSPADAPF